MASPTAPINVNLRKLGTRQLLAKVNKLSGALGPESNTLSTEWVNFHGRAQAMINAGQDPAEFRAEALSFGDTILQAIEAPVAPAPGTSSLWDSLERMVDGLHVEYPQVQFPLTHLGTNAWSSTNGVTFALGELGAGYLSERIRSTRYSQWTKLWRENDFDGIAVLLQGHAGEIDGRMFIAAVVNGQAQSFMTNYQMVAHRQLLDLLKSQGLAPHLLQFQLTPMELILDLKVADLGGGVIATLRVKNGYTGHYALRFTAALIADGYEWELGGQETRGRRRHLSKVSELMEQLKTAVDDVGSILLERNLKELTYHDVITQLNTHFGGKRLTVNQEKLMMAAEDAKCQTALDFISVVAPYGNTKGWAAAVASLLDPVVSFAAHMGGSK